MKDVCREEMLNLREKLVDLKPIFLINKNFEIVDFNSKIKDYFPKIKKGEKCYKLFYGYDKPCFQINPFDECPLNSLKDKKKDIFLKEIGNKDFFLEGYKEKDNFVFFITDISKISKKFKFGDPRKLTEFIKKWNIP